MTASLARAALLLSLGVTVACGRREADGTTEKPAAPQAASTDTLTTRIDAARIQGTASAPVWVVEISDFQCPFCKTWHDSTYDALRREFVEPGTVRLAYVNYPLPNHPNAFPAAEAAMCAGAQGRFWEMHDGLFESQRRWGPLPNAAPVFDSVARAKGVDVAAMRRCIQAGVTRALIRADAERAQESGVEATPSFIIGGDILVRGAQPIETFRRAITQKLSATPGSAP
ncbi:MAG TPA: thioredoxin domain-containing protein [Gemmatimonadaceae bacterium]|nr:thioredoxin domain-containing protein [Gemmatimonadaceae bacterium]